MKIAVWHNLPAGGGKRALYDHVRGLIKLGHQVEAWCPPSADQKYLPLSDLIIEHVVPWARPATINRLDEFMITLEADREVQAMEAHCQICADEIDRGSFDILLANSCQFFAVTAIGRLTKTPAVIYLQEAYRPYYEALPESLWAARPVNFGSKWSIRRWRSAFADLRSHLNMRVRVREEIRNAKGFDRILVNSYFSRESLLRAYGVNSTVCYLGVDTDYFEDRHEERVPHVIGLGWLTETKNARLGIEALARMSEPRPKLIWVANVAASEYETEMRRLAAENQVSFEVRTRVPDADLIDLLNRGLVLFYAPRLEPFGLAPLEAAACGMPTISVAEGGLRETVIDNVTGFLVQHDADAVASAITRLRDDKTLAARLGANAHEVVVSRWTHQAASLRLEAELKRCTTRLPH